MKISTKLRYGLRFVTYLGAYPEKGSISLKEVATKENISVKYLEQIVSLLKPLNILQSARGNNGGYRLIKDPKDISLYELFRSLQGQLWEIACVDNPDSCKINNTCSTRDLWVELNTMSNDFLKNKKLDELVKKYKEKQPEAMYFI